MRAKIINEIHNFERSGNPLSKMKIGGVNFTNSLVEAIEEWKANMERAIVGKTITTEMRLIVEGYKLDIEKNTVKVNRISNIYDSQSTRNGVPLWVLVFESEDGNRYVVDLDQKIWIHES
jgi:hypothetical protein